METHPTREKEPANPERILNYRRLPGRLTSEQVAVLLGLKPHDIPVLCKAGILVPLANPAPSAPKYFDHVLIEKIYQDQSWFEEATAALAAHWKRKNSKDRSSKIGAAKIPQRRSRYAS